jgi:hypothetical protein
MLRSRRTGKSTPPPSKRVTGRSPFSRRRTLRSWLESCLPESRVAWRPPHQLEWIGGSCYVAPDRRPFRVTTVGPVRIAVTSGRVSICRG